jgi:hypothetical protein
MKAGQQQRANELTSVAAPCQDWHDQRMVSESFRSTTPDLFATATARASSASPLSAGKGSSDVTERAAAPRHVPPKDLPRAILQLRDDELDRLHDAVLVEQKRRGRRLPQSDETSKDGNVELAAPQLTPGKLNAVRAAFKAGVTPSRIARQFGITQSDVRKALARDPRKRPPTATRS